MIMLDVLQTLFYSDHDVMPKPEQPQPTTKFHLNKAELKHYS